MTNKYALIDLENIQPTSLQKLKKDGYQLKIFVGASQTKIALGLVEEVHGFGDRAEYIRIESSGKNALDFHIAFYMGQISAKTPDSQFIVLSKDTGYDALLKHMRGQGIPANRSGAAIAAPQSKPTEQTKAASKKHPSQMSMLERLDYARAHLTKAGKARPAKRKTLASALTSAFQKKLDEPIIHQLIDELIKQGIVIDDQGSISYQLKK